MYANLIIYKCNYHKYKMIGQVRKWQMNVYAGWQKSKSDFLYRRTNLFFKCNKIRIRLILANPFTKNVSFVFCNNNIARINKTKNTKNRLDSSVSVVRNRQTFVSLEFIFVELSLNYLSSLIQLNKTVS